MWAELRSIFERVSAEPAVRVVVLSSSLDKTWTVGLDCRCFSPRLSSEDAVVPKALCIARVACDHVVDSENSDGANRSSSAGTRSSSESLPASGSPPRACRSGSNTPTAPSRVMATAAYSSANRTSRTQFPRFSGVNNPSSLRYTAMRLAWPLTSLRHAMSGSRRAT
jgi:hypothetical protein